MSLEVVPHLVFCSISHNSLLEFHRLFFEQIHLIEFLMAHHLNLYFQILWFNLHYCYYSHILVLSHYIHASPLLFPKS